MRKALGLALLCVLVSFSLSAQEPLVPRSELKDLERVAGELARAGHAKPWRKLLTVLTTLGLPEKDLAKLRRGGERQLSRKRKSPGKVPSSIKRMRAAAQRLSAHVPAEPALAGDDGEPVRHLARQLLTLDSDLESPNLALGHEKVSERWSIAGEDVRHARRVELLAAMQRARRLDIEIEISMTDGKTEDGKRTSALVLAQVVGRPIVLAKYKNVLVYSMMSAAQTARILRQILRAVAFANFALGGRLEVPKLDNSKPTIWVDRRLAYDRCAEVAHELGWLTKKGLEESRLLDGVFFNKEVLLKYGALEVQFETNLLSHLCWFWLSEEVLRTGFYNWVCMGMFGAGVPLFTWTEIKDARAAAVQRTTTETPAEKQLREEMMRLAEAGLAGSRSYLRFLAARSEDPPWTAAMRDHMGQIRAEELLKATFTVEYLIEQNELRRFDQRLRKVDKELARPARFEKALQHTLVQFEQSWRKWFIGLPTGLAQTIGQPAVSVPKDAVTTLRTLNDLRARAFSDEVVGAVPAVGYDHALSSGCIAHALYLGEHPDHAASWPEAHEQNPEHDDWSAAGAWAAGHAVIAPGTKNGTEAIDGWMGTFYHRLPLLDPGLVRVGFGHESNVAVMDSGSMVAPLDLTWYVGWPADGMSGVPVRFQPELPNPVPGEDQSRFGYPITLQLPARPLRGRMPQEQHIEVRMTLHKGGSNGKVVDCWYSSPENPTNPELAPAGCYCLIPKAPLERGATYTVVCFAGKKIEWSFKT